MNTVAFAEVDLIQSNEIQTNKSFTQVPNRVLEGAIKGEISPEVFQYYCWVCQVSNRQGKSWWSVERQAKVFGVSTRTITRWRSSLVERGYTWLAKRMGQSTITIVVDHPQRPAGANEEKQRTAEEDTRCPVEEDTRCPVEEDTADVVQTISKNNNQITIAAAETKTGAKSDLAAAAISWDAERWDHVCQVFANVGVDLSGCLAYLSQRPEKTKALFEAWDGALRHSAWILAGRIRQSQEPIGVPLRVTIATEALDTAPSRPEAEPEEKRCESVNPASAVEKPCSNFDEWNEVLARIEAKVPEPTYNRWFGYLEARLDEQGVTIICDDEFDAEFSEKNFTELVQVYLKQAGIEGVLRFSWIGAE